MNRINHIKGFLETSFVDWRGKISAVIFLGRCNFRCPYCHNHRLVLNPDGSEDLSWAWVLERLYRLRGWVDGVCITGGEPTLHDSLGILIREARSAGFLIKLDTNGSKPEILQALIEGEMVDAVSMDIKAPLRPRAYARCAGRTIPLARIQKSIQLLGEADLEVEFRTTVVPGLLDEADLLEIARLLPGGIPYHLQGFRPQEVLDPKLQEVAPYPEEELERMREQVTRLRPLTDRRPPSTLHPLIPQPLPRALWASEIRARSVSR